MRIQNGKLCYSCYHRSAKSRRGCSLAGLISSVCVWRKYTRPSVKYVFCAWSRIKLFSAGCAVPLKKHSETTMAMFGSDSHRNCHLFPRDT